MNVQSAGGLPDYICRIARAVRRTGKSTSQAIAIAVSRVKKWAAGGDDVDADTRAKAAKALAEWEKLKAKSKAKDVKASNAQTDREMLMLANKSFNVDNVRDEWTRRDREQRDAHFKANPGNYADAPPYTYVKEMWSDYLIVKTDGASRKGDLFKVGYEVDAKGGVTFKEPVAVKTEYVVVKQGEMAGDDISDASLKALMSQVGPCPKVATDQVMLSISERPSSALEQVLTFAQKRG